MYLYANRRGFLLSVARASSLGLIWPTTAVPFLQDDKTKAAQRQEDPVYDPGGEVAPPKLLHYVEPEFSPSSSEAYVEGTVNLSTVVTTEGRTRDSRVVSGLTAQEDHRAIDALKQWTFKPGTKSGKPVNVRMSVQIDFHLL